MANELNEQELNLLKKEAYQAKKIAEQLMHKYACEAPLGDERINAFETYNDIRLAGMN